jgi:hypothetical protein
VSFQERITEDPVNLYEELQGDPKVLADFVRQDSEPPLTRWFEPTSGWENFAGSTGRFGEEALAVEWVYLGVHTKDWVFNGIRATGNRVEVRGCTVVALERGEFRLRRYIDWAGLFAQLGLTMNWRLPVEQAPGP